MPVLFIYILKLSASLAAVFLFYQLVLRKLTFYNSNRWYLLGYSILSFLIPFIDISQTVNRNQWTEIKVVQWIPVINDSTFTSIGENKVGPVNYWIIPSLLIILGIIFMLIRILIQFISFRQMVKKAELLSSKEMKIYQVNESIIPFSFGNSVFINRHLHSENELQEIIRHEFVHVKQRHSIDIIWGEILCVLNWYNPFAWLIKRSIRQNLEFIADGKVIDNGIDRKQYQYLLLKVIGNNHFSIASKFNFSSLKKRIAMMNKLKSTKRQLLRMLFLLPATAILLLAFRKQLKETSKGDDQFVKFASIVYDKQTNEPIQGAVIKDEISGKAVKSDSKGYFEMSFPIEERTEIKFNIVKPGYYNFISGHILGKKYTPNSIGIVSLWGMDKGDENVPCRTCIPATFLEYAKNPSLGNEEATDIFKRFLKGENINSISDVANGPIDTVPKAPKKSQTIIYQKDISTVSDDFEITNDRAVIHLKNGETEEYDLKNKEQLKKFEDKYGKVISTTVHAGPMAPVSVITADGIKTAIAPVSVIDASVNGTVATTVTAKTNINSSVAIASTSNVKGATAIVSPVATTDGFAVIDDHGYTITGNEDVLVTITKNTTAEQLEEFKKQMKEKGIELSFDNTKFNSKGILIHVSGTMKSADGKSKHNFSATDFKELILATIKDGERTYLKVSVRDNKKVVI